MCGSNYYGRLVRMMQMCRLLSDPPEGTISLQRFQSRAHLWPAFCHHLRKWKVLRASLFPLGGGGRGSWPPLHRRAGSELPAELRRPERVSWAQTGTRVVSLRSEAGGAGERTVIMAQLWCNPVPSWRWELIIFFILSQYLGTRWLGLRDNLSVVSNEEEK